MTVWEGLYVQPWRVTWPGDYGTDWRFHCTWQEAMATAAAVATPERRVKVERISDRPAIRAGVPVTPV